MAMLTITSRAFAQNGPIPSTFTCDGADVNPPILIGNVPPAAKSLALIMDDPDAPAGTWVHWVVWNIAPATKEIRENTVPEGAQEGMSDFRRPGYGGPCPPSGTHRYYFKLYALDAMLALSQKTDKGGLEKAMQGHVLEKAELVGIYARKRRSA
jgi:Raf kinase inhibitor-like YbhB/YbcL family protein